MQQQRGAPDGCREGLFPGGVWRGGGALGRLSAGGTGDLGLGGWESTRLGEEGEEGHSRQ